MRATPTGTLIERPVYAVYAIVHTLTRATAAPRARRGRATIRPDVTLNTQVTF